MITIKTKHINNIKTKYNRSAEVRYTIEDRIEDWFKSDMRIKD